MIEHLGGRISLIPFSPHTTFSENLGNIMAEEKIIYVDELAGSDETGTGVESSPVKTALKAVELGGESVKILIKKDEEGFKDISGAALKKAKKAYTELQRKLKKQEEQKKKAEEEDAKKAEEEAKALEKAKSIVLTEDESLPAAQKVQVVKG